MRFSFGKNWQSYSQNALTPQRIEHARQAFIELLAGIDLRGKRFIDIGFGQGLSLVTAAEMGAEVLGIDIDKDNLEAIRITCRMMGHTEIPQTRIVSILDDSFVHEMRGGFDIVHSWGVLHHTGNMMKAIENACILVTNGGYFVCSIYNRHWSSPIWKVIKWSYNKLPGLIQRLIFALFYPIIYTAKWVVTRENPKKKKRGMDFFHDLVDWLGGYPYEYATLEEIRSFVCGQGFECLRIRPAQVPTGCNEFVFKKTNTST
jgi:2-polyprenyl-6-hydroxyphenyl methylase/3-demethylubiquinone-9 3-methyltransferase